MIVKYVSGSIKSNELKQGNAINLIHYLDVYTKNIVS